MTDPIRNWRQLCAELLQGLDENRHPEVRYPGHLRLVMAAARTALAAEPPVLLQRSAPAPVPVAERPWEREGWCTDWGWCWVFVQGRWLRDYPQNYLNAACLPHWAILQSPHGEEVAQ